MQMLFSLFMALFLPCTGMTAVFVVYVCLLWFTAGGGGEGYIGGAGASSPVKAAAGKGLSPEELEKVPKVRGEELVMGNECAVCLDEIESDQTARMVPGCNHGFHLQCADTWLSRNSICPVCRAAFGPEFFLSSQNPC